MHTVQGEVVTVVYHNPENGYVIARLDSPAGPGQVTVVGTLGDIAPGESLRLTGEWVEHPKFGRQFKAEGCEHVMPATLAVWLPNLIALFTGCWLIHRVDK